MKCVHYAFYHFIAFKLLTTEYKTIQIDKRDI